MTPTRKEAVETQAEQSFEPFSEPNTIPAGWDVSAFSSSERDSVTQYGMMRDLADESFFSEYKE